jgi:hypothetical protein
MSNSITRRGGTVALQNLSLAAHFLVGQTAAAEGISTGIRGFGAEKISQLSTPAGF